MTEIILAGVNIQWPWSELLITGQKLVETRSYELPEKHRSAWLALIETPGKEKRRSTLGPTKARTIGLIKFSKMIRYETENDWIADFYRHRVPEKHPVLAFNIDRPKWGWVVEEVHSIVEPVPPPIKRGIVFASECKIPSDLIKKYLLDSNKRLGVTT